jgi:aquaporin NIP
LRKCLAEVVGTFCLVFAGTGAVVVNQLTHGEVTGVGIGLVFGLAVLAMIYAVGHISGAHLNPAVTLGFFSSGRMRGKEVPAYLVAQCGGAFLASFSLRVIFGGSTNLGVTLPSGTALQSLVLEFVLTFILMFVIMGVATDDRAESAMAGVAIGAVVALEAIFAGPVSGASMNPARSLAPALVSGNFSCLWIYWLGPMLGSVFGARMYRWVRCPAPASGTKTGCC